MIDERVERCARAAYQSVVADAAPRKATWDDLPEWWRKVYRKMAIAVLNESMADSRLTASVTTSQASFNFGAIS